jgi:hypothetical protein
VGLWGGGSDGSRPQPDGDKRAFLPRAAAVACRSRRRSERGRAARGTSRRACLARLEEIRSGGLRVGLHSGLSCEGGQTGFCLPNRTTEPPATGFGKPIGKPRLPAKTEQFKFQIETPVQSVSIGKPLGKDR